MKFIETAIVFDRGDLTHSSAGWAKAHDAYSSVIKSMTNPEGEERFLLRPKEKIPGTTQWRRNGVAPIKSQFQRRMIAAGWHPENPLRLDDEIARMSDSEPWLSFPTKSRIVQQLHQNVGGLDFWLKSEGERVAIEWETGNISSSHRSVNKLCLALAFGLLDACTLIVPSRDMYEQLTDRVGNWRELAPYLPFWREFGKGVRRGLLVITTVEHDALDGGVPFIVAGKDGRSSEGRTKLKTIDGKEEDQSLEGI